MKIMVVVDLKNDPHPVLSEAKRFAELLSGEIWLIHVAEPDPDFVGFDPGPQSVRDNMAHHFREEHATLERLAGELREAGVNTTPLLIQGPTVETILNEADKLAVEIIITGYRGHGVLHDLLGGSVSRGILHDAKCPVLVVPPHDGVSRDE